MNPSDDQSGNWQFQSETDQPAGDLNNQQTDYPTEEYQPADSVSVETVPAANVNSAAPEVDEPPVSWTANEYVDLPKGVIWYGAAVAVVLALIAVDIFFLKSYTFSVLLVVMAVALFIYSSRPPRSIQYTLSGRQGLYVGEKLYHLSEFRSFGLIDDDGHHSIMLIPVKRFAPGVSVYFPEEAGEQIVDILGQRLPMETIKLDVFDIVIRKLRL